MQLEQKIVRFVNKSHRWAPISGKDNQNGFNKAINRNAAPLSKFASWAQALY